MTNQEIAKILYETAALYEMNGVDFKPRAYEKAALGVGSMSESVAELYRGEGVKGILKIPGVGRGIAEHIHALLEGRRFREYETMRKKTPVAISELMAIEGVGPRMIKTLWEKLCVKNVADLEKAARAGKIRTLTHFGEKSEQKILKGIELLKTSGGRQVLGFLLPEIERLEKTIQDFPEVKQAIVAGSVRRRKETIGDIDILAVSANPKKVMKRFLKLPFVVHVYAKGDTKTMVRFENGLDADLRVVPEESFGAALNYFTGSKEHNVALREIAIKKGWKLNEYGLFSVRGKKEKMIAGKTEEELYAKLGLSYIEPELREMKGEIEVSRVKKLPHLIGYGDLKGDLQVQTDWTDGKNSIEEYAKEAERIGLEYIAITDHTRSLAMTGGADEKKLERQMAAIDQVNAKRKMRGAKLKILKGAEVNIMKDGKLDIADETLAKLEVVGAAVHHYFNLSREEQTQRIIRAMENPHVDIIFHLTTRKINQRLPIDLDIDKIIEAARKTGTVLEIDAYPGRSDIKDEYIKKCVDAGVKMSIDSDAHSLNHFQLLSYGISQARRGWAKQGDIINTYPVEKMIRLLKNGKRRKK